LLALTVPEYTGPRVAETGSAESQALCCPGVGVGIFLAGLLGARRVREFALPRFNATGSIPACGQGTFATDQRGQLFWRAGASPSLPAPLLRALEVLDVKGEGRARSVLSAHVFNLLQEADFDAEYPDHADMLAASRRSWGDLKQARSQVAASLLEELGSLRSDFVGSAAEFGGAPDPDSLLEQRLLDSTPAFFQGLSFR
jgi:hypothetical protein